MSSPQNAYPSFDLSPFCANDQVYLTADTSAHRYDLPNQQSLLQTISSLSETPQWPITLVVIELGLLTANGADFDEHTRNATTLAAGAMLSHCVRQSNNATPPDQASPSLTTRHTVEMTGDASARHTELFRLTSAQFALLSCATAGPLTALCEHAMGVISKPVYIGQQQLQLNPKAGIARGHQHRPDALLRLARTALYIQKHGHE
jgi:hypothetical protein